MDQKLVGKIEKQLLDQKKKLEKELGEFSSKSAHNPEDYNTTFPDFGDKEEDNAVEVAQYSDNLTLERSLEASLRDVNKALENLKNGTYGICKYCKKPIDERRLEARPTSSACIECKTQLIQ